MSQRIVLFESHAGFADEIRSGFSALGVQVDVFDDPNVGVDSAAANPPSLILLTVELAQMNGFLVCKKIKKTPGIDGTPLIILSSDPNADEIFDQHKKLRTRADDYLRKPISFDEVLAHVRSLVAIESPRRGIEVDEEIDAFADSAFGSLVAEDSRPAPVEMDVRQSLIEVEEELTEIDVEADLSLRDDEMPQAATPPPRQPSTTPPPPPAREPTVPPPPAASFAAAPSFDETALRSRIEGLESDLAAMRIEADAAVSLRAQVADLTAKAAKGGGVSSRDYLDLREALNTKDKEILDFRDQISARDKQLIDLRDQNLAHARTKADLDDRVHELETKLTGTTRQLEAVTADREAGTKRHDDLKTRFERTESRLKKVEDDYETARATHAAETALGRERSAEALAAAEASAAAALAAAMAAAASEKDALLSSHEAALAAAESRRSQELDDARSLHANEMAGVRAAHDESIASKLAEHAAALAAALDGAANDKSSALASLSAEHAATVAANAAAADERLASELASLADRNASTLRDRESELASKHEGEKRLLEDDHARQLALLGRKLADTEGRASTAEASLAETQSKLADVQSKLADSESRSAQKSLQIEELEAAKSGLGDELSSKLAALETAHSDADGLRATIAAVEAVASERSARIDSLDADRARLVSELEAARGRIAADAAVIERVHRALSIGLGLLEDQKQNAVAAE